MDRYAMVPCPACNGQRGHVYDRDTTDSWLEHTTVEAWEDCEDCDGQGEVQRVDRLAYLIGERDELPRALAKLAALRARVSA